MTRVLVTCWPFPGHLLNQVGIAHALRDRGHEVAFYTGASARGTVEGEGFEFFGFERVDGDAIATAVRELEQRAGAGRARLADVRRCFDQALVAPLRGQVADVGALADAWRPDVIVCDLPVWGPMVVLNETTDIPVALSTIFLGPAVGGAGAPPPGLGLPSPKGAVSRAAAWGATQATEVFARRLRDRVDEVRAEHGLAPMGHSVNAHTLTLPLTLVPGVRELDYDRREVPPAVRYVGPLAHQLPGPAVEDLPDGRPVVHVAASTMAGADATMVRAALDGLADLPVTVVATGRAGGPVPANARVLDWVDHRALLPRCDVVITAGGSATVVGALRAGVPLVAVPTVWDKPDNARRVVEAGVGVQVPARRCTPERLRAAVEQVLQRTAFRTNARRIGVLLDRAPGPAGAAELLEDLTAARRPEPAR